MHFQILRWVILKRFQSLLTIQGCIVKGLCDLIENNAIYSIIFLIFYDMLRDTLDKFFELVLLNLQ